MYPGLISKYKVFLCTCILKYFFVLKIEHLFKLKLLGGFPQMTKGGKIKNIKQDPLEIKGHRPLVISPSALLRLPTD